MYIEEISFDGIVLQLVAFWEILNSYKAILKYYNLYLQWSHYTSHQFEYYMEN